MQIDNVLSRGQPLMTATRPSSVTLLTGPPADMFRHLHIHTDTYTDTQTYTHRYIHRHIHTDTYTDTYTCKTVSDTVIGNLDLPQ